MRDEVLDDFSLFGVSMFWMAKAFFLIIHFLAFGKHPLLNLFYHLGGTLILEVLGWVFWISISILFAIQNFLLPIFYGVAWWGVVFLFFSHPPWLVFF